MPDSNGVNLTRRPLKAGLQTEINYRQNNRDSLQGKIRHNAYVKLSTTNGGTLPLTANTFDSLYANADGKPDAILNSVKIEQAGDMGSLVQVHVQFTCFRRSVFIDLEKKFLRLKTSGGKNNLLTVKGGYVNRPTPEGSTANSFTLSKMMIFKFGYTFDQNNQWTCNFSAMGSAMLTHEKAIENGTKALMDRGLMYKYQGESIPVVTIPQYIKYIGQGNGMTRNIDLDDLPAAESWNGDTAAVCVFNNPNSWTPDTKIGELAFKVLQSMGFVNEDEMRLFYVSLESLFGMINKFVLANSKTKYVCNSTVTKGGYLYPVCSADPWAFLLPGAGSGKGWSTESGDINEDGIPCDGSGEGYPINAVNGTKADYNRLLVSYAYLTGTMFGQTQDESNEKTDAATETEDSMTITSTGIGPTISQLFKDIEATFGGAIKLTTAIDPNDPDKINVVAINEPDASKPIKPARFSPLKGDGMTRNSKVSCNPPSADAYAVAAGTQELPQTAVVEAISDDKGTPSEDTKKSDRELLKEQMIKIRDNQMSFTNFSAEQITALRSIQTEFVNGQTAEVCEATLPTDMTMWPLKLEITIDGIYGFEFGNLVTSTYLPNQFQQTGLKPVFSITKVEHNIQNNDWQTTLSSVCTLCKVSK